ncbi:MAG: Na-K-Cl cotransporter, partial [Candidatus Omnitrophica bacterium]|nr:Na-K-Cl cotransporter [Candidatus Omnitrophota bacterium]
NMNLSILIALQLKRNWDGVLRIVQVVYDEQDMQEALNYLLKLKKIMRLPLDVEVEILVGNFMELLKQAPKADVNIFGMQEKPDIELIRNVSSVIGTSVLFLRDSENESALA